MNSDQTKFKTGQTVVKDDLPIENHGYVSLNGVEVLNLKDLVIQSAKRSPDALAINAPDGELTYGELDRLANRIARALIDLGVSNGDRVGIWLDKSVRAAATMQGILRIGAAYVPLDPLAPTSRIQTIVSDCDMRAIVSTESRLNGFQEKELGSVLVLYADDSGSGLCWDDLASFSNVLLDIETVGYDELAYILYTSGSTGVPKGVCISHRNALAYVDWAAEDLNASPADRFSNHAPFHFDLSVLDLYAAFLSGASVHIVPDGMSYVPRRLVEFIIKEEITIWYSVPSALTLMMEQGGLLDEEKLSLHTIVFAGEPFPIKYLRRLYKRYPRIRYLNYYGPTETNVCTYYEVTEISEERTKPVPIGVASSGDHVWAVKADGSEAKIGEEGELMVSGPTVMLGYWGNPPHGEKPYATGDIVQLQADGNYMYVGRRDHMVKVRGHRIELGDIEAALDQHPAINEVAVIVSGSGVEARLVAYIVSTNDNSPTLLDIKRHCAERLPRYMIIDEMHGISSLPRTRNGKVDRLKLSRVT